MNAVTFKQFGDSSVLDYEEINRPKVKKDEVLIEMKAIGLNFADIYRRKGNYHLVGKPPYILGYEGSGVIIEVGEGVSDYHVGDRVAFADVPFANAEYVAANINHLISIPENVSYEIAGGVLLQGLTAQYLVRDSYAVKEGTVALVHACAGGVGQFLTQYIKYLGGKVIGLTSSEEKAIFAKENGADEVFYYHENWVEKVLDYTVGKGVDVVYDSVGSTLQSSFEATKITGTVVFYGMAGGDPEYVNPRMLMDTSKTLTGGDLWNYLTSKKERLRRGGELFDLLATKTIQIQDPQTFSLKDARKAHDLLESRKSKGKIILIP